jgi:two-component system NarL family response regulator
MTATLARHSYQDEILRAVQAPSFDEELGYPSSVSILIAEDDPLLRNLLADILEAEADFTVVSSVGRADEALHVAAGLRPQVLLLDLSLPDLGGSQVVDSLLEQPDPPKVLILSGDEREETQLKAARSGAHGFIGKSVAREALPKAIRTLAAGEVWFSRRVVGLIFNEYPTLVRRAQEQEGPISLLSDREREVLLYLARGLTNKQIADALFMSISTVKSHIRSVFQKLDLTSRTEAAIFAVREGLEERVRKRQD